MNLQRSRRAIMIAPLRLHSRCLTRLILRECALSDSFSRTRTWGASPRVTPAPPPPARCVKTHVIFPQAARLNKRIASREVGWEPTNEHEPCFMNICHAREREHLDHRFLESAPIGGI